MTASNVVSIRRSAPLVDQFGRDMRAGATDIANNQAQQWDAAGSGWRLRGWNPGLTGPNSAIIYAADTLRARCRDIIRKNPWAVSAINSSVSNVVGSGIK